MILMLRLKRYGFVLQAGHYEWDLDQNILLGWIIWWRKTGAPSAGFKLVTDFRRRRDCSVSLLRLRDGIWKGLRLRGPVERVQ